MQQIVASPFGKSYLVVRAGSPRGIDLGLGTVGRDVLVRQPSLHAYGRASYELNLGCNYACPHCYLGLKKFEGMVWPDRERCLIAMRDAGVLYLQLTGGEPMVDPLFSEVYRLAWDLGMMVEILSNGSRLHNPKILELLTTRTPHLVSLSLYGATAATYDAVTVWPGSFGKFMTGLETAVAAGLRLDLSLVITDKNAHEIDQMRAVAEGFGLPFREYGSMSPTIYGGAESLPSQSPEYLRNRKVFTGCDVGHTSFHLDPHGRASICKIGREPNVPLPVEGIEGLSRLQAVGVLHHVHAPGHTVPQGTIPAGQLLPAHRRKVGTTMVPVSVEIAPLPGCGPVLRPSGRG